MKAFIVLLVCISALVNAAPAPQVLGVYPGYVGTPLTHHAYEEHHDHHFSGPTHHVGSPFYRHVSPVHHNFGGAYVAQPIIAQPVVAGYPYGYTVVG